METIYPLKKPFTARIKGADVEFIELPLPEVITVGTMRKVVAPGSLLFAHNLTEICAGLGPFEAAKLETQDALGYLHAMEELLVGNPVAGFDLPEIKPFKALLQKITVEPSRAVEFVAQVLQLSGMKRSDIDAMDYREFEPVVRPVLELFPGPKN
jgi:hypothetical protein